MKVLLITYDNGSYIHTFPQSVGYIAAAIRNAGHQVTIYAQDIHHYPEEHLTEFINNAREPFDVVGVSVIGGYYQYRKLLSISRAIRQTQQPPFFIIGGHGPAPEPDYFMQKTGADAIVIGEGEETIQELLAALESQSPLKEVEGIAFNENGKCVTTPRRQTISDVDTISWPAYDLFSVENYRLLRMPHATSTDFVMPLLSGRGCPFHCTFCYRMDPGFRPRNAESIIEEINYLKQKYNITYIAFFDELLMSSKKRTVELCEAFLLANLNIKWDCNGRLNYADPEVLAIMKRAGCVFINYGIESLDNEVLRRMRKGLNVETIIRGIEATLAARISPGLNIIFGNPGDTRDILQRDVEFLLKYDDGSQLRTIRPVTPYPGTELYQMALDQGLLQDCKDFYEHKHLNSDLLAVNFTDLTDDEFHQALLSANTRLLDHFFQRHTEQAKAAAKRLYLEKDNTFRGFRQS